MVWTPTSWSRARPITVTGCLSFATRTARCVEQIGNFPLVSVFLPPFLSFLLFFPSSLFSSVFSCFSLPSFLSCLLLSFFMFLFLNFLHYFRLFLISCLFSFWLSTFCSFYYFFLSYCIPFIFSISWFFLFFFIFCHPLFLSSYLPFLPFFILSCLLSFSFP